MPAPGTPPPAAPPHALLVPLGRGASLPGADLRGADLRGLDLGAADLRWADLRQADLRGCTLHGARLRGARLEGARLDGAAARDCDLEAASLDGASLAGADLEGAILLDASLEGATLAGCSLRRADLRHARLVRADLAEADLAGADLEQAALALARLDGARWRRARISGATGLDDAVHAALLGAGAWQGALAPELAPLFRLGQRLADPGRRLLAGRAVRVRSTTRQWASGLQQRHLQRSRQRREEAEQARRARLAALPGGPGQDLSGQDLHGRHLEEVDWTGAILRGARLDGAWLTDGRLEGADLAQASLRGARLSGARLAGARLSGARLVDADLRRADLAEADLSEADLTGADLRGARLHGAVLRAADLTAARLPDLDLTGVVLDEAVLDQAELSGARLRGASVRGADLRGALGLDPELRAALVEAGARTTEGALDQLVRGVDPRHAIAAAGILALGVGAYVAARVLAGDPGSNPGLVAAEEIRTLPPAEAMARFEGLAAAAAMPPDKVGYLVEAAGQARQLGEPATVERLLREALAAAGEDVELGAEVRLALAAHIADPQADEAPRAEEAMALVDPLLDLSRQTNEQRARAILLYEELARARGLDPAERVAGLFAGMGELADAAAELHLALASALANRGDTDRALAEVEAAAALPLSEGTALRVREARARTLDRAGALDEAGQAWQALIDATAPDAVAHQAAVLALADLRQRQGQLDEARALLTGLLEGGGDARIGARAWLVQARVEEAQGQPLAAAEAYRAAIDRARTDPETAEEARLSLARVLGRGDPAVLASVLEGLGDEARALVEVQARLGEAREALESGQPGRARAIYEQLSTGAELDPMTRRDVRTGLGEALAQEGDVPAALVVWRDLLSETARPEDRVHLEVRIAQGLLRGGRLDEAGEAYAALAASTDADIAVQGRLGQAQVQLALGNREQARSMMQEVADAARDPAWRVRALEELADMAAQDGDPAAAVDGWRAVLGAVPPGHAAASRARVAIVAALAAAGRVDEALAACDDAERSAGSAEDRVGARLTCAEVLERAQRTQQAHEAYQALLTDLRVGALAVPASAELPADAAAGAARTALLLDDPDAALAAADAGLELVRDEGIKLNLLSLKVAALDALDRADEAAAARQARDAIVDDIPEAAAGALVEAAHQARARGALDEAVDLMRQAREAQSEPAVRAVTGVELGDVLLEAGRLDEARQAYATALAEGGSDAMLAFQAGMGLAELDRRAGQPAAAAARLAALSAPDRATARWLLEARARALAEAGDPDAPAAWEQLVALAGEDGDVRSTALRGQADALYAVDRYAEALELYRAAAEAAPDPVLAGWSELGVASALDALDRGPEAAPLLDRLRRHRDPEIGLQAAILRSHLAARAEDWRAAVAAVDGLDAAAMGPAWDASLVQARAGALAGAGRPDEAAAALDALAARWPGEEEAVVPAWLARAELARQGGGEEQARAYARRAVEAATDPGFKAQAEQLLASLDEDAAP